jgi:F-type H+-transporting ATPase subunit alpha
VASIYAVVNGHLDEVEVKYIRKWEADFLSFLETAHPAVLEGIRTKKALDDTITAGLKAAIAAFKPLFKAE